MVLTSFFYCEVAVTPEEFIKKHPFPKDGAQLNSELVQAIMDPLQESEKQKNLQKLFEVNARLVWVVFQQFNYGQTLGGVMGFVYEGLTKACEKYKPELNVPFYQYALQTIRGIMQNWYNYNENLVHVPVMRKKDHQHEYVEVTEYSLSDETIEDFSNTLSDDMDAMLIELEFLHRDDPKFLEDVEFFKKARNSTVKSIAMENNMTQIKIRKSVLRVCAKLQSYMNKWQEGMI